MIQHISALDLKRWLDDDARSQPVLLDVREPWEIAICRLEGARHIPMRTIPARLTDLDRTAQIVVICHHGVRSFQVAIFLDAQGFDKLVNLQGGLAAWARDVDSAMTTY